MFFLFFRETKQVQTRLPVFLLGLKVCVTGQDLTRTLNSKGMHVHGTVSEFGCFSFYPFCFCYVGFDEDSVIFLVFVSFADKLGFY